MRSETAKHALVLLARTLVIATFFSLAAQSAAAQRGPARGKLEPLKDPELEVSSKHDLDVARWYMTKRKAYEGARDRLQEILDTYPDFSKIDEVIYLMGEVNHKMGKDAEAAKYYNDLIKNYPGSQFFKKAKEQLAQLKPEDKNEGASDNDRLHPAPSENPKKTPDKPKDKPEGKSGSPSGR